MENPKSVMCHRGEFVTSFEAIFLPPPPLLITDVWNKNGPD
jgi:hypothetical protein